MPQLSPGSGLMTLILIFFLMSFLFTLLPFKPMPMKTIKMKSNFSYLSTLIFK
uniref:ATP synthase F0 subunit 8 n=1 Tax=Vertigo pusilla TaxID=1282417 RepID=A0A0A6ZAH9_9EUPU|nr:ATP synthase F0 subunit 8 [Vertigo pusilla]AGC52883.1 ATP synthase F0 subunit 8 [Vertigo pusilla]